MVTYRKNNRLKLPQTVWQLLLITMQTEKYQASRSCQIHGPSKERTPRRGRYCHFTLERALCVVGVIAYSRVVFWIYTIHNSLSLINVFTNQIIFRSILKHYSIFLTSSLSDHHQAEDVQAIQIPP